MGGSSNTLHESPEKLTNKTQDMHRALVSLQEELEAVDWYQQRADAATDPQLRAILLHNMDEEVEHAAMVLEWLRRIHPSFDGHLKTYLWSEGDITGVEEAATGGDSAPAAPAGPNFKRRTIGALGRKT